MPNRITTGSPRSAAHPTREDAAKKAARLGKAKQAHDELIAAAYRTQADALAIESEAKRRLADEYDAAQQRGEVAKDGRPKTVPNRNGIATAADIGLSRREVHEARIIRDAEEADPGIIRRTVDQALAAGKEPTNAKLASLGRGSPAKVLPVHTAALGTRWRWQRIGSKPIGEAIRITQPDGSMGLHRRRAGR